MVKIWDEKWNRIACLPHPNTVYDVQVGIFSLPSLTLSIPSLASSFHRDADCGKSGGRMRQEWTRHSVAHGGHSSPSDHVRSPIAGKKYFSLCD